jgi:hypothetical protein
MSQIIILSSSGVSSMLLALLRIDTSAIAPSTFSLLSDLTGNLRLMNSAMGI